MSSSTRSHFVSRRASLGLAAWRGARLAALALAVACAPSGSSPPAGAGADADRVAARINGSPVTVAELDALIKDQLFEQASQGGDPSRLYEIRSQALEQMVQKRLLDDAAAERGMTPEALLEQEAGLSEVTEAEVAEFFEQNKARMGGRSLDDVGGEIRTFLNQKARAEAQQAFVTTLRGNAEVEVALQAPRVDVEAVGASLGPDDAPVTIIEFSDYACPYCKRAETVVQQILERYPEQVRFVYRHFPLESIHPQAFGAAEAAMCANEQGQFWAYHEKLFEHSPKHGKPELKSYARAIGLDTAAFDACLDERQTRGVVQADLQAGQGAGVRGTPAFFVNGLMMSGSRTLEEFVKVIESELAADAS